MRKGFLGAITMGLVLLLAPVAQAETDVWVSWRNGGGGGGGGDCDPGARCTGGGVEEGDLVFKANPLEKYTYHFGLPEIDAQLRKMRRVKRQPEYRSEPPSQFAALFARPDGSEEIALISEVSGKPAWTLNIPDDTNDFSVLPGQEGVDVVFLLSDKGKISKLNLTTGAIAKVAQAGLRTATKVGVISSTIFVVEGEDATGGSQLFLVDAGTGQTRSIPGTTNPGTLALEQITVAGVSYAAWIRGDGSTNLIDATAEWFPAGGIAREMFGASSVDDANVLLVSTADGAEVLAFDETTYRFKPEQAVTRRDLAKSPIVAGFGNHPVPETIVAVANNSGNGQENVHVSFFDENGTRLPNLRDIEPAGLGVLEGIGLKVALLRTRMPAMGPFENQVVLTVYDPTGVYVGRDAAKFYYLGLYNSNDEPRLALNLADISPKQEKRSEKPVAVAFIMNTR